MGGLQVFESPSIGGLFLCVTSSKIRDLRPAALGIPRTRSRPTQPEPKVSTHRPWELIFPE